MIQLRIYNVLVFLCVHVYTRFYKCLSHQVWTWFQQLQLGELKRFFPTHRKLGAHMNEKHIMSNREVSTVPTHRRCSSWNCWAGQKEIVDHGGCPEWRVLYPKLENSSDHHWNRLQIERKNSGLRARNLHQIWEDSTKWDEEGRLTSQAFSLRCRPCNNGSHGGKVFDCFFPTPRKLGAHMKRIFVIAHSLTMPIHRQRNGG